jgi:hypothetical protein
MGQTIMVRTSYNFASINRLPDFGDRHSAFSGVPNKRGITLAVPASFKDPLPEMTLCSLHKMNHPD